MTLVVISPWRIKPLDKITELLNENVKLVFLIFFFVSQRGSLNWPAFTRLDLWDSYGY